MIQETQDNGVIQLTAEEASQTVEGDSTAAQASSTDQELLETIKDQAAILWDKELFSVNDTPIVVNQFWSSFLDTSSRRSSPDALAAQSSLV